MNVSLLLRKPNSNSGSNLILRTGTETSNAAAIASDSANPPDISDELNLSHDNGGKNVQHFVNIFSTGCVQPIAEGSMLGPLKA